MSSWCRRLLRLCWLRPGLLVGVLLTAGCAGWEGAPRPTVLSPLYNVPPSMLAPDGTFATNGLFPINPNDQR